MQKVEERDKVEKPLARSEKSGLRKQVGISAIITVSESADGLEALYDQLRGFLSSQGEEAFEMIFVDNGVGGGEVEWLERKSREEEGVALIRFRSAFSEASALDAGFRASSGKVILYMTTRVRIDPGGLSLLMPRLHDDADLVVAWRHPRSDSKLNWWISRAFNRMTSAIGGLKLHDLNSGCFVARKEVLRDVLLYGDLDKFLPLLAFKQGYRVKEEQIAQLHGKFRKSYYVKDYFNRLLDLITIIFLTNYSKKPIHFLGFLGVLFSAAGGILSFYLFVYRITGQGPIAGRPLLLLGVLLLVIGIQMIAIGLLGEMMIYTHASEIKEYNVEKVIRHSEGYDETDRPDSLL